MKYELLKHKKGIGLGASLGIIGWGIYTFYTTRYAVTVPIQPVERTILLIMHPYLQHMQPQTPHIVWTQVSGGNDGLAPWHRDWVIPINGIAHTPWGVRPVHYRIYVNGQHGGIAGWFMRLSRSMIAGK